MAEILTALGITLERESSWPPLLRANVDEALFAHIGENNLRRWITRPVTFNFGGSRGLPRGSYSGLTSSSRVTFFANQTANPVINILHEFGHLFDNLWQDFFTKSLEREVFRRNGRLFGGWTGSKYMGLPSDIIRKEMLKTGRIAGGDAWQQRGGTDHFEDWADIFSNATLRNFNAENETGQQILAFVARMHAHVGITTSGEETGPGTLPRPTPGDTTPSVAFDTKVLPAVTATLAIKIVFPVLNLRSNTNVSGGSASGDVVGIAAQNSIHQVFEVVRVNERIWARIGTNKWAVVEKRDGTKYAEFVQKDSAPAGGSTGTSTPPPTPSGDPFDNKVLPAVTSTLAIKVVANGLNLRKSTETRNGLPSGLTNGTLDKNAVQKVLEVVRIEDRIWARVGTEKWAVVEKRDGTKYAEFVNK